ncbi:MAG: thioredoxin family protein [Taibaiella sp.]|nr:thioredoxin family protein [Taibaiella sp.]
MTPDNLTSRITKSDYAAYLNNGISYDTYKAHMEDDRSANPDSKIKEYINLNQHRMSRVEKTYHLSEIISNQLKWLKHKTYWLVLTEHWCGDASQALPVFNQIAEMSEGKIELKLVYRDQNPELMDMYLTNKSRSIPKLVQLDEHFNVTGIWGPRPTPAQKLVVHLKSNPETAPTYANDLHLWYAKDKQISLEAEIKQLLVRANLACTDCNS